VKVYFGSTADNEFRVFPNPVQAELNVVFEGSGKTLFVEVYDAGGKMVLAERRQYASQFVLSVKSLKAGMYYLVVSDGVKKQASQFVKQ